MFSMKLKWVKFAEDEMDLKSKLIGKNCSPMKVNGKAVLIVFHQNQYFLVKNRCPHQGKSLSDATCEDGHIVCQWHRYGFDLKTGRGAGLHLENYPIEKREDGYYAGFEYFSLF
jgi:nitrite reductase/ring-hydroxylating ferredoxin subunit